MVEFGNSLEGNTYLVYASVYFFGTLSILVLYLLHIHTGESLHVILKVLSCIFPLWQQALSIRQSE